MIEYSWYRLYLAPELPKNMLSHSGQFANGHCNQYISLHSHQYHVEVLVKEYGAIDILWNMGPCTNLASIEEYLLRYHAA